MHVNRMPTYDITTIRMYKYKHAHHEIAIPWWDMILAYVFHSYADLSVLFIVLQFNVLGTRTNL